MKFLKKIIGLVFNLTLFIIGFILIFLAAYQFGWSLLVGPLNWGNDIPFALSFVHYLDRYLPSIPRWFYVWAGGMRFMANYPPLVTQITAFLHQLLPLSIVQIARLFYWLAIPLAGVLVMIFSKIFFNNWLIAILAGLFLVFSPDSWLWTTHGGFYAAQTAFPFMVATFIFTELFFQKEKRHWFVFAVIFSGLAWLAHPMIGMGQTISLGVYGLGQWIKRKNFFSGMVPTILIAVIGFLLFSFWTFPFANSRPQGIGVGVHQIPFITIKEFLGLAPPHDSVYITSTFFAGPILVLAALGLIFSLIKKDKTLILIGCALTGIILMTGPGILTFLIKGILFLPWVMVNVRATVLPRLFLPMIAAYGAFSLATSPFLVISFIFKNLKNSLIFRVVVSLVGSAFSLVIVFWVFQKVVIIPKTLYYYLGFGPVYNWIVPTNVNGQIMINEGKEPLFPPIKDSLERLLTFKIPLEDVPIARTEHFKELVEKLKLTKNDRIDIWPLGGDIRAGWNTASGVSQIPAWTGGIDNLRMAGYQAGCFYDSENFYCSNNEVKDQALWWGIKLILLGEKERANDPVMEANLKANFKREMVKLKDREILYYQVPKNTGLASITNKPLVLVIGANPPENDAYETVYRSLSRIGFGYEHILPIEGRRFIDDYSITELKKYPMIILYGYKYHNKNRAWGLLSSYVKDGGSLFVETGWQYKSKDWGKASERGEFLAVDLPNPLPVTKTQWGNLGTSWSNLTVDPSFFGPKVKPDGFAPPVWKGQPWGLALAEVSDLKEFGQPLLTASKKVIVAKGNFGQGKIVWSGMNLFGHIQLYKSQAENDILLTIFSWLKPEMDLREEKLNFKRITPDKVITYLDKNLGSNQKVMFKELASSGWQAYLGKKKLPILKTGPLWKLVVLPENLETNELVFVYQKTLSDWFYQFISLVTGFGLFFYLIGLLKIPNILKAVSVRIEKIITNWKNREEDDERDY